METKKLLVFLVTVLVMTAMSGILVSAQSPIVENTIVRIDGRAHDNNFAVLAGETYSIGLEFDSLVNASDVEISAWIQTNRRGRDDRTYMDLIDGSFYYVRDQLRLTIPEDIKPEEKLTLYVRIETDKGNWEGSYPLSAQRQSHNIDVLSVDLENSVKVGDALRVNVVLKNMGRQISEDTFVDIKIPELGISRRVFFEDLSPVRICDDCDMANSRERTLYIVIPEKTAAGRYTLEVTASNKNTDTKVTKDFVVTVKGTEGTFIANPAAKNFAVGEEAVYELILVNTGSNIVVYNLVPQSNDALTVSLSEYIVVVPAGSSQTVKVYATANREGTFGFTVNVNADGLSDVARFNASVDGKKQAFTTSGNGLIAITIVLAIIFVVLLAILVVLLTRKPETAEEFGESYY